MRKDDKGNLQSRERIRVERNTRAWAILQYLLVERFAFGEALKRAVQEAADKPIKEAISRIVGKENRQVFAPRLRKYLPDIPQDVVVYEPKSKRYLFRVTLRVAVKD